MVTEAGGAFFVPRKLRCRRERTVLARLLTRLAFRKHAVARLPRHEAELAGLEVVRLRQRVRRMLGAEGDCQTSVEADRADS